MAVKEQRSDSVSALSTAELSGLSFLPTPGPGDSEGGEIYPPAIESSSSVSSGRSDAPGADQSAPVVRAAEPDDLD
jgi:hypothetical protein